MKVYLGHYIGVYLEHYIGGHATRCALLEQALKDQGFRIVERRREAEIWIWDYPFPPSDEWISTEHFLVSMGQYDSRADCVWHPFGDPKLCHLTGREFVILSPRLTHVRNWVPGGAPRRRYAVYLGGDPQKVTSQLPGWIRPKILSGLSQEEFWFSLLTSEAAVLGWGQSFFEANFLGVPCVGVLHNEDQEWEALRAGCVIGRDVIPGKWFHEPKRANAIVQALSLPHVSLHLDTLGGRRTARAIREHFEKWTQKQN